MYHKIDVRKTDVAEDIVLVMPMYNFVEYSPNFSDTTSSLWFYSKDVAINFDISYCEYWLFKDFKDGKA